jgi:type II secretion system protein C
MTTRKVLLATVLTLSCWLLADTVNVYVSHALIESGAPAAPQMPQASTPTPSSPDPEQHAKIILDSGLFPVVPGSRLRNGEEDEPKAPPPPPPLELTGKLKLLGTTLGDRFKPSAAIEHQKDKRQALYFLHEQVEGFGEVAQIQKDGVIIRQGARHGVLPLLDNALGEAAAPPPKIAAAHPVPSRITLDRRALQESLSDVSKLLTEARAMPYYNLRDNGKLEGWQLVEIKPKSVLERLGLAPQDVLLRINGTPVLDPATMLRLLQELQQEKIVKLDLLRHTDPLTLTYEIR